MRSLCLSREVSCEESLALARSLSQGVTRKESLARSLLRGVSHKESLARSLSHGVSRGESLASTHLCIDGGARMSSCSDEQIWRACAS